MEIQQMTDAASQQAPSEETQEPTRSIKQDSTSVDANATTELPTPTKAKIMFEQVELFELDPDEARDTEYVRKLIEPHYSAATDAKFEYRQEGDCLIVTMIKQNPPKG